MLKDSDADLQLIEISETWLAAFNVALMSGNAEKVATLFMEDCHWRNILAFDWQILTTSGSDAIVGKLMAILDTAKPPHFHLSNKHTQPRMATRAGREAIELIFDFTTEIGPGSGVLRLRNDRNAGNVWQAWTLSTTLQALDSYPERTSAERANAALVIYEV